MSGFFSIAILGLASFAQDRRFVQSLAAVQKFKVQEFKERATRSELPLTECAIGAGTGRQFQGLYRQLTNSMGPMQTPAGAKQARVAVPDFPQTGWMFCYPPSRRQRVGRAFARLDQPEYHAELSNGLELNDPGV